jgi:hypothetical protein
MAAKKPSKTPTKKPAKKTPAKKTPSKKTPAKKTPSKKAPAKKAPTKKTPTKKSPTKKSPTKKSPTKKSPTKKSPTKKSPTKKAPTKKAPAKKAPTKKAPTKKAPAKKAPAKSGVILSGTSHTPPVFLLAHLPVGISPYERADRFEDPLEEALGAYGQVTGAGTSMDDDGNPESCDIEIEVSDVVRALPIIRRVLVEQGAPDGTMVARLSPTGEFEVLVEIGS